MPYRRPAFPILFAIGLLVLATVTGFAAWNLHALAEIARSPTGSDAGFDAFADRATVARNLVVVACLVAVALTLLAARFTAHAFAARSRAEDAARFLERRYRLLADYSGDVISLHEADGSIGYVSPAVAAVLGHPPEALTGKPTVSFVHPEDAAVWGDAVRDLLLLPVSRTATIRLQHAQGHYVWVETTARAIFEVGQPAVILASSRDISPRKAVEEQLAGSRQFAQQLADVLPNLLYVYDLTAKQITYVNSAAQRMLGVHARDLLGPRDWLAEGCHPDDLPKVRAAHAKLAQLPPNSSVETEFRYRHADGTYRWLLATDTSFAFDDNGTLTSILGLAQDQTERRLMADELRRSEQRLALALESTQDGLWDWDLVSGICYYAPRWKEMLGYDPDDELTDQAAWESLVHPDDLPVVKAAVREHYAGRRPIFEGEVRARHRRTGEWIWILSRGRVVARDELGRPLRIIGTNLDITERKAAEERFRTLFDYSSDPHFILDDESGIIDCNKAAVEILRAPGRDAIIGRHYAEFSPEFQPDGLTSIDRASILDEEARRDGSQRFDWLFRRFDGDELPCEVTLTPAPLDGREVLLAVWHDLTERLRVEAVTRAGEAQTRGLVEANRDCLLELDMDGRLVSVNDGGRDQLELDDAEAVARKYWPDLWPADHRADAELALAAARGGRTGRFQGFCPTFRGSPRWWDVQVTPVRDADGRTQGLLCSARDLTDLKDAMAAADEARQKAEQADRAKCEFLAGMTSEINGPLGTITGLAKVARADAPPELAQMLRGVADKAESLRALLNDVLEFARLEAGGFALIDDEFGLRETVGEAMALFADEARGKGIELISAVAPDVPDRVVADAGRLRQVLTHLVGSAVRATPEGSVTVRVTLAHNAEPGPSPGRVALKFAVIDTDGGRGDSRHAGLSESFATTLRSRTVGDSGLGLLISARLVEHLGGRLTADLEAGRGSTFHFTASLARPAVELPSIPPRELNGKRALLVEDHPEQQAALLDQLRELGMVPTAVATATEAAELPREPAFDLAVIDVDFWDGGAAQWPPVVLLTHGDRPVPEGMAGVVKPVHAGELLEAIRLALGLIPESSGPTWTPSDPGLRVIVADDNPVSRRMTGRLLESLGHVVVPAADGLEAVDHWRRGEIDVILMDVLMPRLDGYAAAAVIRHLERGGGRRTRIVAMTNRAVVGDRRRAIEAGMDELLLKPVRRDDLGKSLGTVMSDPPTPLTPTGVF